MVSLIFRFAPPLLLMGVIFFFSAQPDLNSGLGTFDFILRKCAHMTEFGLLWFLWFRAFNRTGAGYAALITLLYAASDEWHQSFVHGRVGSPVDLLIDSLGVLAAFLLYSFSQRRANPL